MPISVAAATPMPGTAMGFPSTHWTVILEARDGPGTLGQDALASLCAAYWYPLYAFIRRRGANPQDAEDLTQGFLCHFLERDALARVQPAAGKFRSFLLGCLKNYLSKERERARAQKRGGACQLLPLDGEEAELRYARELADTATPEALFERRWAISVLEQTMTAMRQEYSSPEKRALFEDLQSFLFTGRGEASRSEVAARRNVTVGAIDVAIHRLRQRFGALLREQVARTVSSEHEVDEEIRYLRSLMSA